MTALVRARGDDVRFAVCERFADVAALAERPAIIAVDMPIGLPARAGPGGRAPERLVRPLLGARQSSVFSIPSRAAMSALDHREASALSRATSDPPRGMSIQTFCIGPKIRELDTALRADPQLAARTFEVHPEVAFWRLNGEKAVGEAKHIKGRAHPAGLALRRRLLTAEGIPGADATPPRGASADDLIDALACAAIARRIASGRARPFPDPPDTDAFDLRIAIWA